MYVCRHFGKRWHQCDFQVVATSTSPRALIEGDEKSIQSLISGLGNDSISIPKWNTQSRMVVNPTLRNTIIVDKRSIPVLNERNSAAAVGNPNDHTFGTTLHQYISGKHQCLFRGMGHHTSCNGHRIRSFQSLSISGMSGLHHKPWIPPPFCRIFWKIKYVLH